MTSNMIYIVALGVGFKCPRKIHLNTQCVWGGVNFFKISYGPALTEGLEGWSCAKLHLHPNFSTLPSFLCEVLGGYP